MRIALQFGRADYVQFFDELGPQLTADWLAFFRREPHGQFHADQMLATVGSALCAAQQFDIEPDEFLWWVDDPKPEPTQAELDALCAFALGSLKDMGR